MDPSTTLMAGPLADLGWKRPKVEKSVFRCTYYAAAAMRTAALSGRASGSDKCGHFLSVGPV